MLSKLCVAHSIDSDMIEELVSKLLNPETSDIFRASALTALTCRELSVDELYSFYRSLRARAVPLTLEGRFTDCCGTGGDKKGYFNISTTCAFIAASCGARVAKHGNRSASGVSGSADVLQQASIPLFSDATEIQDTFKSFNLVFLFAPTFHPTLKYLAQTRKELAFPTLFNILGPLLHPADLRYQFLGVASQAMLELVIPLLIKLERKRAIVVHSMDGMDELSCFADSLLVEINDNRQKEYIISPKQYSLHHSMSEEPQMKINDAAQSLAIMKSVFNNEPGPATSCCILNTAGVIYSLGEVESFERAIDISRQALINGSAKKLFDEYTRTNN